MDRLTEAIIPPPSAVGIAPLGVLYLDEEEIPTGTTVIIDTFGYTYITLFIRVNRAATITLAEVSQDGVRWRRVEEIIKAFDTADQSFVNLNNVIETREVLMYRYLKVRMDAIVPVVITLEIASKLMDMGVLLDIRDAIKVDERIFRERIERIRELAMIGIDWSPILPLLEAIHEILTNPDTWDHDQKDVSIPGTPVQLPPLIVPDSYALVVKAKTDNDGNIYIGNSKDTVKDSAKRVTLEATDAISLEVKKASAMWIDAEPGNSGDGVEFWCEKRS